MSSVNVTVNNKFSVRLAHKVHRLKKMLKPVIRFMHSKKASKSLVGVPNSCDCSSKKSMWTADETETDQNDANEALEARLQADIVHTTNKQGGLLSVWVQGRLTLIPVVPGHFDRIPIPVSFASTCSGDFLWTPLADSDVCLGAGSRDETTGQTAQEQVPTLAQRCAH